MGAHEIFWAKWGKNGTNSYPLASHLIDSAAMAEALLDVWVHASLLERLACLSGRSKEEVRDAVVSAAALHDLGKATPVFQAQLGSLRAGEFAGHAATLDAAGLTCELAPNIELLSQEQLHLVRRHEVASSVMLEEKLVGAGASGLSAIIAGHHGRWNIPERRGSELAAAAYESILSDESWAKARRELLQVVTGVTGARQASEDMGAAVPVLQALVCLADWLASDLADRDDYRGRAPEEGWDDFYRRRRAQAEVSVTEMLGTPRKPSGELEDLFGFQLNRPVQTDVIEKLRPAKAQDEAGFACYPYKPGLTVVAVPTGEGKTEAALAQWLLSAPDRQGLFFALPTMATADAMFTRVSDMFRRGSPRQNNVPAQPTTGALLHSRSILNSFYDPSPRDLSGQVDGCSAAGLVPGRWFQGRHRALLAPVAVGTVDQLLSAVLRHRFSFMRLLAAANKTLVLDEVHSYDPYMSHLLERLLEWAGALQIDVILLSATLPRQRLNAYISAYTGVPVDTSPVYPAVFRARNGSGEVSTSALGPSGRERTITIEYHASTSSKGAADVARLVVSLLGQHPGSRVGVIVNTVGRCQDVAAALSSSRAAEHLHILHSRFPAAVRSRLVSEAEARFGKDAQDGAAVLVATQIVEQSMDLDFDILISELAPAAALLQRAGRLQRHGTRTRPPGLDHARLIVVHPEDLPSGQWAFLPYTAAEIRRTWEALGSGTVVEISVPGDVQALVDEADVSWGMLKDEYEYSALVEAHLVGNAEQVLAASRKVVPTPGEVAGSPAWSLSRMCEGDLNEGVYQTRWSQELRVDALLIGDQPGTWIGPLPARPSREEVISILGCTVPLSGATARAAFDMQPPRKVPAIGPEAGTVLPDHPLLSGLVAIDVSNPEAILYLDERLGLLLRKGDPHG